MAFFSQGGRGSAIAISTHSRLHSPMRACESGPEVGSLHLPAGSERPRPISAAFEPLSLYYLLRRVSFPNPAVSSGDKYMLAGRPDLGYHGTSEGRRPHYG